MNHVTGLRFVDIPLHILRKKQAPRLKFLVSRSPPRGAATVGWNDIGSSETSIVVVIVVVIVVAVAVAAAIPITTDR